MVRNTMIRRLLAKPATPPPATERWLERPLLHEVLWLGFGGVMAVRLLIAGSGDLALGVYLAALLPYACLIARGCMLARRPSAQAWQRIRLLYPFLLMNLLYQATRIAVPALRLPIQDAWLADLEQRLFGFDPRLLLDQRLGWAYTPLLSEIFSCAYMLLFVMLVSGVVRSARGTLRQQAAFATGIWSTYAIGLLGYTLIPARGPYLVFWQLYQHPVAGWYLTNLNRQVVATGSPGFDVFPSLHVAGSAFLLLWDWYTARRWFLIMVAPVALLWLSTIYLRYHYLPDLLAGAILALASTMVALRVLRHARPEAREPRL